MSPLILVLCSLGLLAGGAVKGVVGLGLPLVALPLLTLVVDVKTAVGLTVVPMIVSNLLQSFQGGFFRLMLRRFWPLLVTLTISIILGTRLLVTLPDRVLDLIIGSAVIILPLVGHFRPEIRVTPQQERWLGPVMGVISGLLGGISTFYGPPLMLYTLCLRLPKEEFVPAISLLYFVGALGLFAGIFGLGVLGADALWASILMLIPVGIGMWIGQKVHVQLSDRAFARLLLGVYITTGLTFLAHALP